VILSKNYTNTKVSGWKISKCRSDQWLLRR